MNYSYVANKVSNEGAIKINDGVYNGLIFNFGKVKFDENEINEKLNVTFEYNVHHLPDDCQDGWEDGLLVDFLGKILMEVLEEKLQTGNIEDFIGEEDVN